MVRRLRYGQFFGSARPGCRQADAMPPDVALVWKFTRAPLGHDADNEYRGAIVKRWARRALVSLAFAATAARLFQTVEYALGHGKACRRVVAAGTPVMLDHGRVPALSIRQSSWRMPPLTRVSSATSISRP